jgi:hypothetical protein
VHWAAPYFPGQPGSSSLPLNFALGEKKKKKKKAVHWISPTVLLLTGWHFSILFNTYMAC